MLMLCWLGCVYTVSVNKVFAGTFVKIQQALAFAARDVFTEAAVEKFELKYVRSSRVAELYVRAPVILGTMVRPTFWLTDSNSH